MWVVLAGSVLWPAADAFAQLDPLLFIKRDTPNVVLAVDVRGTMLKDADGTYFDPQLYVWKKSGGAATGWETALGLQGDVNIGSTTKNYRRVVRAGRW